MLPILKYFGSTRSIRQGLSVDGIVSSIDIPKRWSQCTYCLIQIVLGVIRKTGRAVAQIPHTNDTFLMGKVAVPLIQYPSLNPVDADPGIDLRIVEKGIVVIIQEIMTEKIVLIVFVINGINFKRAHDATTLHHDVSGFPLLLGKHHGPIGFSRLKFGLDPEQGFGSPDQTGRKRHIHIPEFDPFYEFVFTPCRRIIQSFTLQVFPGSFGLPDQVHSVFKGKTALGVIICF